MTGIVFDVGGTHTRAGFYDGRTGKVRNVLRRPTPSFLSHPGKSPQALQDLLLESLADLGSRLPAGRAEWVSAAVAGPVSAEGVVHRAPSLWGPAKRPLALRAVLHKRTGLPAVVVNDVTAAAHALGAEARYRAFRRVGVITISTGLGMKVFDTARGECLLSSEGFGGEIGHLISPVWVTDAPCSCGEKGHINLLASGRGAENAARHLARSQPALFARSALHARTGGDPARIVVEHLAALARRPGDDFGREWLSFITQPIAGIIHALALSIGVEKFIIIGGLALALGKPYREALMSHLRSSGLYGRTPAEVEALVDLAPGKEEWGLLGAGLLGEQGYRKVNQEKGLVQK